MLKLLVIKKNIDLIEGKPRLVVSLLYGSGLRLIECLRLRIKDIDFDYRQIIVRDGKGEKESMFPCIPPIG